MCRPCNRAKGASNYHTGETTFHLFGWNFGLTSTNLNLICFRHITIQLSNCPPRTLNIFLKTLQAKLELLANSLLSTPSIKDRYAFMCSAHSTYPYIVFSLFIILYGRHFCFQDRSFAGLAGYCQQIEPFNSRGDSESEKASFRFEREREREREREIGALLRGRGEGRWVVADRL